MDVFLAFWIMGWCFAAGFVVGRGYQMRQP
jgi:hypothetical protein